MGIADRCPRCGSLMVAPSYDDEGMYCITCGTQGDVPTPTHRNYTPISKLIHTARYRAKKGHRNNNGVKHLTVRYRMAYGDRNSPMPALVVECPWCGGVTKGVTWSAPRRESTRSLGEREMFVECPSNHTYSMVCDADGDYYWR
jgi:DNA-directed RNA polymerase subunit M/transcription elongation factor TFIIS